MRSENEAGTPRGRGEPDTDAAADIELPKVSRRHQAGYYSGRELADMLGLTFETFAYHVKMGYVPRPEAPFQKRKYYTEQSARAVMAYFLNRKRYQRRKGE